MIKTIKFENWSELKRAIPGYEKLGYECEVRGWDGMRYNILTIKDTLGGKGKDEPDTGS